MYSIAYFSPTGNTKYLAYKLRENIDNDTQLIDIIFANPKELQKNTHLIIMFSIHAFNPPKEVIKFVSLIQKNLFENVSIIAVGCNNLWVNQAASLPIRKVLTEKGYNILIDRVIAMPLTFIMRFPEDTAKAVIVEANHQIEIVSKDLKSKLMDDKIVPNKAKILAQVCKIENQASKLFGLELYANNDCIFCGKCWRNCPSKNIIQKNNKPKFKFNCSMCMRCIYECPVNSINPRISKFIPIKDGYKIP